MNRSFTANGGFQAFTRDHIFLQNLALIFLSFEDVMPKMEKNLALLAKWVEYLIPFDSEENFFINRIESLLAKNSQLNNDLMNLLENNLSKDAKFLSLFPQKATKDLLID
jgi:hypothetical protein